jgi:hypothetical protein
MALLPSVVVAMPVRFRKRVTSMRRISVGDFMDAEIKDFH